MGFVLTDRPSTDENMALEALHGTTYGHDHWVDLHSYLTCRSQNKNLQEEEKKGSFQKRLDVNNHLHLIGVRLKTDELGRFQSVGPCS